MICRAGRPVMVTMSGRGFRKYVSPRFLLSLQRLMVSRRSLATSESLYAFLSICLVIFVFLIMSLMDSSSPTAPLISRLDSHSALKKPAIFMSPFSAVGSAKQLEHLIQKIESHSKKMSNNSVPTSLIVALAVNYAYRRLALNFICNLNRLNISNYIVLAMDRPVFDYLSQRDAHVFFHDLRREPVISRPNVHSITHRRLLASIPSSLPVGSRIGNDTAHQFGTAAFVETSRRKSLLVLRLLTLGYTVLFSDVDVVWVSNPIPRMLEATTHFVLQSDRSSALPDEPLNYNFNSGLYLARATPQTIIAMRAIIKYAYAIRRSEQKAFNYVLCGAFKDHHAGPGSRVGATECIYSSAGTTAQALPLDAFPNGSDESLWKPSSDFTRQHPNVIAVHANYVADREQKERRIRDIGFWYQSEESHVRNECVLP